MNARRYIKPAGITAALLIAGFLGYWTLYEQPRKETMELLDAELRQNEVLERSLRGRNAARQELRAIAATTLGAAAEEVDARFRAGLQRIADSCRLADVQINTSRPPTAVVSPIGQARRRITNLPSMQREVDFHTVRGDLKGSGTLEQVLRAMAIIEAQPWVHRVEAFSISPEGRDGDRYALSLSASTIILPAEIAPRDAVDVTIASLPAGAEGSWAGLVARNPFREPQRRAAEGPRRAPPPALPPPPPAPPPYNEWRLTGVVESRLGTEAFLVNTRSDERVAIGAGASIAGAKLVAAEGEVAIFEIDGEEYELFNGQTFEQRRPKIR